VALQKAMFPGGKLSPAVTAQSVGKICAVAKLARPELAGARCLMVEETGAGRSHPFSGEKLSPVLAVYRARDFDHAFDIVRAIYDFQGAGHSVGVYTENESHIRRLAHEMTVSRVIVKQAHTFATGGSFDNGMPFSLSMGCGTWGGNSFSDNLNYLPNITRSCARFRPGNRAWTRCLEPTGKSTGSDVLRSVGDHLVGPQDPVGQFLHVAAVRALDKLGFLDAARRHASAADPDRCAPLHRTAQHHLGIVVTRRNGLPGDRRDHRIAHEEDLELDAIAFREHAGDAESVVGALDAVRCIVEDDQEFHVASASQR
jgi:hypothetical protein